MYTSTFLNYFFFPFLCIHILGSEIKQIQGSPSLSWMLLQQNRAENKLLPLFLGSPALGEAEAQRENWGKGTGPAGLAFRSALKTLACPAAAHLVPNPPRCSVAVDSFLREAGIYTPLRLSASGSQDERRGGVVLQR